MNFSIEERKIAAKEVYQILFDNNPIIDIGELWTSEPWKKINPGTDELITQRCLWNRFEQIPPMKIVSEDQMWELSARHLKAFPEDIRKDLFAIFHECIMYRRGRGE